LDTIANIWLNGEFVAKTNNMFIPFRFNVTDRIKLKNNSLLVQFNPATEYAEKLMKQYPLDGGITYGDPRRVYIRKAQFQFGWDWCPSLPGCGIWRSVRLEGIKKAKFNDIQIRTLQCSEHDADISITVSIGVVLGEVFFCKIALCLGNKTIERDVAFNSGENCQTTTIHIEKPMHWWPLGYGAQNLYELDAKLLCNSEVIDQRRISFGIRSVKLDCSQDEQGEKFRFLINNQLVFARGANWIPQSIFAGSAQSSDYSELLIAAKEANVNMLRVWGGGYYEDERFYELCDHLGIMVWQDFMFACAPCPGHQWFHDEIENEASTIITQLRNHPCLILWCGNNEVDWMQQNTDKAKAFDGKDIFYKLLPSLHSELDPDRPYIPTTPTSTTGEVDLNSTNSGTTHQWDVWGCHASVLAYICPPEKIPRFAPEFGLQSLPNIETIQEFCPSKQLHIGSQAVEKHNYQIDGNGRILHYMGDLFAPTRNLEHFIYLSQLTQARGIKLHVEYLRSHNFRNSGVLFWQFNDCFPAITWSAIDYTQKPKALYYYAKRFFSPVLITVTPPPCKAGTAASAQKFSAVVINDSAQPVTGILNCQLIDLYGCALDQITIPISLWPFSTSCPIELPRTMTCPAHPERSMLHLLLIKNGEKVAENLFLFVPDKYIEWPEIQIIQKLIQDGNSRYRLSLRTNAIAKDVQIVTNAAARFTDNFIDLLPHRDYEIKLKFDSQPQSILDLVQLQYVNCT
jgi:beta-mannosidase